MVCVYAFATSAYAEAVALRQAVLRAPLGLDIADDPLAEEFDHVHVGAFERGELVGTASLQPRRDGSLKMRQVAVASAQQGRGVGRALARECEQLARSAQAAGLYCHARLTARPFYEACGWRADGAAFREVGLPHVVMRASLLPSAPVGAAGAT